MKRSVKKAQNGVAIDKTSTGPRKDVSKILKQGRKDIAEKNKAHVSSLKKEADSLRKSAERDRRAAHSLRTEHDYGGGPTFGRTRERSQGAAKIGEESARRSDSIANVREKQASEAAKNPKYKTRFKSGGKIKKRK